MCGAGHHPNGVTPSHFAGEYSHLRYVTRTAIFCDSVCVPSPALRYSVCVPSPALRYYAIHHPTCMRYVTLWGRVTHRIGNYIYINVKYPKTIHHRRKRFFYEKLEDLYHMSWNLCSHSSTANILKVNLQQTQIFET